MSPKDWRPVADICTDQSESKLSNYDKQSTDDFMIVWCDTSISNNERDDQRTLSELHRVSNRVITFTNELGCLEHIDRIQEKNKVILIVSGSLGKSFVPEIYQRTEIYLIYVFCGRKANHEQWAKTYKKIKGVFDNIEELRKDLENEIKNLTTEQMMETISHLIPLTLKIQEPSNINNPKYGDDDHHQPKDDLRKYVISTNVSFSEEVSPVSIAKTEISNNIQYSETVAPYMPYKQQMEFADTGIWPCVCMISETRDDLFNHLHSAIDHVQYSTSTENFLEHFHSHEIDPHLIVLSNPLHIEHVSQLIHRRMRRLYIYCSNGRLNEYDTWRATDPQRISVLQHFDTLTRLILWDLSACVVDIGNYYDSQGKKDYALTRYRYAYRLHHMIQGNLNNRMEIIEFNRLMKLNN